MENSRSIFLAVVEAFTCIGRLDASFRSKVRDLILMTTCSSRSFQSTKGAGGRLLGYFRRRVGLWLKSQSLSLAYSHLWIFGILFLSRLAPSSGFASFVESHISRYLSRSAGFGPFTVWLLTQ